MRQRKKFAGLNSDTFVEKFWKKLDLCEKLDFPHAKKILSDTCFFRKLGNDGAKNIFFENKWENFYSSSFQKIWKITFKTKYPSVPRTSMSSNLVNNVAKSKGDIIDLYSENS